MKFAAHTGLLIEHSIHEALRMIRHHGFDGVEISCEEPHLSAATSLIRVKELRNLAVHELALEIPVLACRAGEFSTASDAECGRAFADFQKILEWAAILGAEAVSLPAGGPGPREAEEYHYAKEAAWIRRCAEEAAKYRKNLLLQTGSGRLTQTAGSTKRLLDMISHSRVGFIHDTAGPLSGGMNPRDLASPDLRKRLMHVHLRDAEREEGAVASRRHGEGEIDFPLLFDTLREIGYDAWVTLASTAHLPECGSFRGEDCDCSHCAFEKLDYEIKQAKRLPAGG